MAESLVLQRWALALGITLTTVGIVRVGVVPVNAPMPEPLPPQLLQQLKAQGWQPSGTVAAQGRTQISNAAGVVLSRAASPGTPMLKLSLIPVRTRGPQHLGADSISQAINGAAPEQPRALRINADQLLRFGAGRHHQAGTCIAGGRATSSKLAMEQAVAQAAGAPAGGWRDRLKRASGLEPLTNWHCLFSLISIEGVASRNDADQAIKRTWQELRPVLVQ